jgi:hypothetical protein
VNPYFETVLVAAVLKLPPPKQTHYSGVTRGAHRITPIHHAATDYILHACSRTDMALTPWLSVVRAQNDDETSICQCIL